MSRLFAYKWVIVIALSVTLMVPFTIYRNLRSASNVKPICIAIEPPATRPLHFENYHPDQLKQFQPQLTQSLNTFALDILRELRVADVGNVIVSPLSIHSAFAMVCAGAQANTLTQCCHVLRWHHCQDQMQLLHQLYRQILSEFVRDQLEIRIGNQLFTQPSLRLLQPYLQTIKWAYYGNQMNVDFTNPAKAAEIINDWISHVTSHQITHIIDADKIPSDLVMVLASAIHMNVLWPTPFDVGHTQKRPFFIGSEQTVMLDMMSADKHFQYKHDQGVTMLSLPLSGRNFQFIILMPDQIDGLSAFEPTLTPETFEKCLSLPYEKITLHLPKFKVKSKPLDLIPIMKSLGLTDAFNMRANFKNITHSDLVIGQATHDAIIEVDERGVKASAVTTVMMLHTAASPDRRIPVVVTIDRSFVYAIQHVNTGELLFLGRYTGRD